MRPRYLELLAELASHRVSHIIVGGVAAILEGAPITTLDLDILVETTPGNLDQLERYPHQRIFVIDLGDYVYLVPFVEDEEKIFLKTIIPSRKALKEYKS